MNMRIQAKSTPRKGVVLLLTLAILSVFGLIVLAYVVLTGHTRRGAEAAKRFQEQYDPPDQTVMQVALEVIRGTNNPHSSIWCHSLLEDVYGEKWVAGAIPPSPPPAPPTLVPVASGQIWGFPPNFPNPERWVGCPLTFLTPPVAGITTRIVDYDAVNNRFLVVAPESVSLAAVQNKLQSGQAINYLIDGRAFSGTGVGFNNTDRLAATDPQGMPYALTPNAAVREFLLQYAGPDGVPGTADDGLLSANEDYDAADYQNMFLAMVLPHPATGETLVPEPSFHRVSLIAYWFNQAINGNIINWGSISDPAVRFNYLLRPETIPDPQVRRQVALFERKFILRPLRVFHPNFDGSNPTYQPGFDDTNNDGQPDSLLSINPNSWRWDVDNDGDGTPDSIWVDLGLPVRQLPDGRRYKPLAAILCVDLDGRLNLNAHGSLVQADPRYYQQDTLNVDGAPLGANWILAAGADTNGDAFPDGENPSVLFPNPALAPNALRHWFRGLGFGPAEINLGPLFELLTNSGGSPAPWQNLYAILLVGRTDPLLGPIMGRYGERTRLVSPPPLPAAGLAGQPDALLANKFFTYPIDWRTTLPQPFGPGNPTIYGTPPDMMGALCVGLDLRGRPIYVQPQNLWAAAVTDNPYKVKLTRRGGKGVIQSGQQDAVDAPFTPAELEAILRPFDRDSRDLPQRLRKLIPDLVRVRHMITTESWDLPVAAVAGSYRWRQQLGNQLLQSIVQRFNLTAPQDLWVLFPPDVLAGLRLNINRPLGDGLDNNNNGVVDEPGEALAGQDQWAYRTATGTTSAIPFDYDGDGLPGATEDPHQALARHLYVLMMSVADLNFLDTVTGSRLNTARMIAQWAVNTVDFRDRDSIMTRFVFDENPFDGWNPTPDPQHTVWGCERPELLITETLAFHDRRTEDLSAYGYAYPPSTNDPKEEDYPSQGQGIRDLDQRYRPQGSLFVELYNPWFENEPSPGEFDNPTKTQPEPRPGVDLAKLNPAGQPIWRIIVTRAEADPDQPGLAKDPDNPDPAKRPQIERAVYFVPRPANGFPEEANIPVSYYPSNTYAGEIDKILPGRYAVIGPAGRPDGDITYIGFQLDQGDPNTDRYIRILRNQVIVDKNLDTLPTGINPPVGIRIDRGYVTIGTLAGDKEMRLSVSEPATGYDELEATQTDEAGQAIKYNPATGRYENPPGSPQVIDKPLDAQRTDLQADEDWDHLFGHNTTRTRFRIIHLQRLADPTQPYDPILNPYRTVDSAPVDLTCFNSRTNKEEFTADGQAQISHTDPIMFHTRQRGERNDDPPALDNSNNAVIQDTYHDVILWKQEPLDKPVQNDGATVPVGIFNRRLKHTLGYLSEPFGTPRSGPVPYNGDPQRPFPWLTWLNRPYTSATELLLVPALPSSRLLAYDANNYYKYYRVPLTDPTASEPEPNPYEPDRSDQPNQYFEPNKVEPYPHLTNYFWSVGAGAGNSPTAPEFHRVLEFVRVPSPFVDTELQLNPETAQRISPPAPPGSPPHRFTPPNHMISYFREPGRINLNTIYAPQVWAGLMNRPELILNPPANWFDTTNPYVALWHEFLDSRRGFYVPPNQGFPSLPPTVPNTPLLPPDSYTRLLLNNPDYPTRFGNPFRSFGGFSNVPPTSPVNPTNPTLQDVIGREVNATLLREKVVPNPNTGQMEFTHVPLFQAPSTNPQNPSQNHEYEYCDINRNPFFRYRDLMRLGNLVTTRSNVYAIWVTIGYFEVQPVAEVMQPDPQTPGNFLVNGVSLSPQEILDIYPDGYMLGQELGSDTGDIKRHRGFFLFDRSIPVGFRRGYDLNVDQGLLIKRIIE